MLITLRGYRVKSAVDIQTGTDNSLSTWEWGGGGGGKFKSHK